MERPTVSEHEAKDGAEAELPVRHIFRWDLDKTYLRTEFDTIRDLIKTALQTPEEKVNVPGSVALLRELTRERESSRVLVTFISGSPSQMRATLEKKFELDGIKPDAFVLKPTLQNILKGRFKAVRGQVGYKLDSLLRIRGMSPPAPETMFGDDAEQDAFIYSLYADLAAGRIDRETLIDILEEAEVYEPTIESILGGFDDMHVEDTVQRIFIHLDRRSPPGRFWVFGPRVIPIANYFQASLVLYDDGVLDVEGVLRVAAGMIENDDYGMLDLANSLQDLTRRRHVPVDALDRFIGEVDTFEGTMPLPAGFVQRLMSRVRALSPLSQSPDRGWEGPVDYLEVLRADRKLRESVQEKKSGLFS
jgi:hypothetical protein